ncbi:MAG: aminotransferase class I/II-fold pyridoxal phosphate-dependent enzyme [Firmicutes bacterium]|nr:aminotransferase class I/II-fold pyridoxal phosphate-dependent enzyme [Bacillota bacterium]MDY3092039.1 aminotransferase class I/II-fold pyridoxal phosphate-dependent enzyme [Erysipelotrichaceae bacterium]
MSQYVSKRAKKVPLSGIGKFCELAAKMDDIISLAIGEPDFDTPWHIRDETIYAIKKNKTHYLESRGLLSLRKEICNYQRRRFNLEYGVENVLVTVGASEAVDLVFRTILDEGDEVIILEPCYVAYTPAIIMAGGVVKTIDLKAEEEFKLKREALINAVTPKTKAVLINYPSNPTGGIMTKEDYDELIDVIVDNDLLVITDEIYAELTYDVKHYSIAQDERVKDRVILISGFSKAYAMTGFRIGYIMAHSELITAMANIHEYTIMCPSSFVEYGALEALRRGDDDIEAMKLEFERRRNYVVGRLNEIGLKCHMPKGAFYVFFNITSSGLSSDDYAIKLITDYKVAVVPGNAFGKCGEGFVRISYASSMDELKEALNRIERMYNDTKECR